MRYPTITLSRCRTLALRMRKGGFINIEPYVHWRVIGRDLDLTSIKQVAEHIDSELERNITEYSSDKGLYEGKAALYLYNAIKDIDISILDNPGFWRYLSLKYFWNFIKWREEAACDPRKDNEENYKKRRDNFLKYIVSENSTESVLTRMFLRVRALGGSEDGHLASALPRSTDFWRSHVIRVRTGTAPSLTRAFVKKQREDPLATPELRQFARRLNRTWTNLLLNIYDDEEAASLIEDLWPR